MFDELTHRHVSLSLRGALHDANDPLGRTLLDMLAMVAEFQADLITMRTREGMRIAKANGRLRAKQPKLNPLQQATWSRCTEPASTARRRRRQPCLPAAGGGGGNTTRSCVSRTSRAAP